MGSRVTKAVGKGEDYRDPERPEGIKLHADKPNRAQAFASGGILSPSYSERGLWPRV